MLRRLGAFAAGLPHIVLRNRGGGFALDGVRRPYHYARYNLTWLNERAVELPLALEVMRRGGRILEVGNVLAHYGELGHEVVDRYERAPGVRNIDVLSLEPGREWDRVVSISTVEHVGVDDEPRDPTRAVDAVRLLAGRVAAGGDLLITVPVGYNPVLDRALAAGEAGDLHVSALRRTGPGPRWEQAPPAAVLDEGYDYRQKTARALLVVRAGGARH
ncbi:class I SAM-dependent methyltransferase [Capillimicrobium parvum]|uniref:Uncharacterized protein n=1 Tax=Capillimicrobium parvum TaxID=2884022 RepID=A0A9E6Y2A5_9ACTN|nr:class I SAM-dependent methyltransferase [Capillimicrobium parvum]UGS38735.1 hypothetical protein DSM104329_05165 [Capillimicrobium parvum]